MKEKNRGRSLSICIIFCVLIFGIFVASIIKPDDSFSENENRVLAQRPTLSIDSLDIDSITSKIKQFTKEYETYITDQFILRDQWIAMKVYSDLAFFKQDVNDVYFAKDGYLIERHPDYNKNKDLIQKNINRVQSFLQQYEKCIPGHIGIMIVPTAGTVLKDKISKYAGDLDQETLLTQLKQVVEKSDNGLFVDTLSELNGHKEEEIYYHTDHHWTTLGAYYGYHAWANAFAIAPYEKEEFNVISASDEFYGTTFSKVNIPWKPDSIELFKAKNGIQYEVFFEQTEQGLDGLYDMEKLNTKDKYSVFLGGNKGHTLIRSSNKNGKKLLVIKDSYAHAVIPFLANHYEEVILLDYRYFNLSTKAIIEQEGITDILLLYNAVNFCEDKYMGKLLK